MIDNWVFGKVYLGIFHFALLRSFETTPSLAQKIDNDGIGCTACAVEGCSENKL